MIPGMNPDPLVVNPDPRLKMLIDVIEMNRKHLYDRIKSQANTDPFSNDHVAARYLDSCLERFLCECVVKGIETDPEKPA